uniref:Uncharacterized protein n=1 Tax=Arundo donax TaxID=35708 RepID=A0A0A8Z5Z8_ARUDO
MAMSCYFGASLNGASFLGYHCPYTVE